MYSIITTTCKNHFTVLKSGRFGTFIGISRYEYTIDSISPTIDVQLKPFRSGHSSYVRMIRLTDLYTDTSTIDVEGPVTHDRQCNGIDSVLSRNNVVHALDDYVQLLDHRGSDTCLFGIDVEIVQCECVCGDIERCCTAVIIFYDVFIISNLHSADPQVIRHWGYDVGECRGFASELDCCFELP